MIAKYCFDEIHQHFPKADNVCESNSFDFIIALYFVHFVQFHINNVM